MGLIGEPQMTRGPEMDRNSLGYTSWGTSSFLLSVSPVCVQQSPDLPSTMPPPTSPPPARLDMSHPSKGGPGSVCESGVGKTHEVI